ncbi:hypothetical protein GOBAR_AA04940 [Gossypium barbadense]|uniref:ATP synthase subunit O, mitochondrial n=1 Tax=Gossypium barbadense TaxID=3634 RepID=A0A2P5YJ67_GOSBA|nr:hypothetical protein GOBAR_AA04940 [Gossypium barbadense]
MAMAARIRSTLPIFHRLLRSDSLPSHTPRAALHRTLLCPELSRKYSTSLKKDENVKEMRNIRWSECLIVSLTNGPQVATPISATDAGNLDFYYWHVPLALFGGSGNYASALYLAAVKGNALDKVESELLDLVQASKNSQLFSQFTKDLSVPAETRVKAINEICGQAKFSDLTKNFLVILAENGRLRHIESIAKRFVELTMAHKGEVKAIVTSVIPLPSQEEKELKETLQEIIGQGKQVKLEQKIDPSILGGLVVEFEQKVFDMSIKTRARQMERFLREPINFGSL